MGAVAIVIFNQRSRRSEASSHKRGMQWNPIAAVCEKPTPIELEMENARLQQLVADLLVRNQQLRSELKLAQRALNH